MKRFIFAVSAVSLISFSAIHICASEEIQPLQERLVPARKTISFRNSILDTQAIVDRLSIKPGMKIADIGAGEGTFTFLMADRLKGTGRIYATDIDPKRAYSLNKAAKTRGMQNIEAVKVASYGVDPFYSMHKFDIILLSEVLPDIWDIENYLKELSGSLSPSGRLFILEYKNQLRFVEEDFENFRQIAAFLSGRTEAGLSVIKKLSPETRNLLEKWDGGEVPEFIRKSIVADMNSMIEDPSLFNDLYLYFGHKNVDEPPKKLLNTSTNTYADVDNPVPPACAMFMGYLKTPLYDNKFNRWAIRYLDKSGAFKKDHSELSPLERELTLELNRSILVNLLDINTISKRLTYENNISLMLRDRDTLVSRIENAGFKVDKTYDMKFFYLLECKKIK